MGRQTVSRFGRVCRTVRSPYTIGALFFLISVFFLASTAAATPSAREILAQTPLNEKEVKAVLDGNLVTTGVVEASKREIGGAVACLVPSGHRGSLEFARNNRVTMPEEYKDASGPIDPDNIEGSLAALDLGGNEKEAKRYLEIEPGFDLNLSEEEIAAFRALKPPKGGELKAVEAKLREIYAKRIRSYRKRGLDGIAPFARGDEDAKGASPAGDLRRATEAAGAFRKLMPQYYSALLAYPEEKVPGSLEFLYWSRIQVLGRPVFMLHQRLAVVSGQTELVVDRQFYASHFLNVGQVVIGLIPVQEGTLAFYANRTWVDKWHGFGTGAKRGIGHKIISGVLKDLAEDLDFCEGLPHVAPLEGGGA